MLSRDPVSAGGVLRDEEVEGCAINVLAPDGFLDWEGERSSAAEGSMSSTPVL